MRILTKSGETLMGKCPHFSEFMEEQRKLIEKSIDENKYYMSERAHGDVGYTAAEIDFIEKHLERVAKSFRDFFCGSRCPDSATCGWKEVFKKE